MIFDFFTVTTYILSSEEYWELPNTNFDKLQLCNIVDVKYDLGNTSYTIGAVMLFCKV